MREIGEYILEVLHAGAGTVDLADLLDEIDYVQRLVPDRDELSDAGCSSSLVSNGTGMADAPLCVFASWMLNPMAVDSPASSAASVQGRLGGEARAGGCACHRTDTRSCSRPLAAPCGQANGRSHR